ncbi:MAG: sigma-70 family RNA polymerase sigma factor [Verrucomicrobia bacterium]|nr:sigma-70 family RNA polymerase sigma factor [Verrucomicrobiota bacterium]
MTTSTTASQPESGGIFPRTRWSMVLAARDRDIDSPSPALEELCRTYWRPVYLYIRSRGNTPDQSEDHTQEFFHRLLEKDLLKSVEGPSRGLLRSFLCVLLKRFLADDYDSRMTRKRGGAWQSIPIDRPAAEHLISAAGLDHTKGPEHIFDRQWAFDLLAQALATTKVDYQQAGKSELFEALRPAISPNLDSVPYTELATHLDMTEGAVKVAVHRLRQRYRSCLQQALRDTLDDPEDKAAAEQELQYLISLFSRS